MRMRVTSKNIVNMFEQIWVSRLVDDLHYNLSNIFTIDKLRKCFFSYLSGQSSGGEVISWSSNICANK
jgi:hypothetical protein